MPRAETAVCPITDYRTIREPLRQGYTPIFAAATRA